MRIEYTHTQSADEAYARISKLLPQLQRQYADKISDPSMSWTPDHRTMSYSMRILGFSTSGTVELQDRKIVLDGKVPLLARPFSSKIEEMIRGQLETLLK